MPSPSEYNLLTIAGSDPSGGAGIQADLKTFAAHSCYAASVLTSLTAQNTTGVQGVHAVPPDFVQLQLKGVLDDVEIHGIKTGMLYGEGVIRAIVKTLKGCKTLPPIVVDPVCTSTSGHTLLQSSALDALIDDLFPLAALITPNKTEAELLLRQRSLSFRASSDKEKEEIKNLDDMLLASQKLASLVGSASILLKGGHFVTSISQLDSFLFSHPEVGVVKQNLYEENMEILQVGVSKEVQNPELVVDLLYQPSAEGKGKVVVFARPRIESTSTHGTGCTLSAAVACGLAKALSLQDAVKEATLYTHIGIATARKIGSGFGPLNHLHATSRSLVPPRTHSNPYPFTHFLIQQTRDAWKSYVEHPFVEQLGKGTLKKEKFVRFIKQDYHYLKYYARSYALLAAKSTSFAAIHSATNIILSVIHEIATHKSFCAEFGVTEEELESEEELVGCTAYGCYILNVGLQGDAAKLMMALMACLLGYGEVGLWLKRYAPEKGEEGRERESRDGKWVKMEGNPYKKWIEDYSGEVYQGAVRVGLETIENLVIDDPPSEKRLNEWKEVWLRCTVLEKGFWDMAMEA